MRARGLFFVFTRDVVIIRKVGDMVILLPKKYKADIAAHAFAINATLVTNNTGEFLRDPGLAEEDWSTPL